MMQENNFEMIIKRNLRIKLK